MSYYSADRLAAEVRAEMARQQVNNPRLADATGIPRVTLWRRLRADSDFTVDELMSVAEFLGLSVQELIDRARAQEVA